MKPDHVKKDVRPRSGRSTGDAPALGRVSRVLGSGLAGEESLQHQEERNQRQRASRIMTLGWSIGLAVIALALVGGSMAWWMMGRSVEKPRQVRQMAGSSANTVPRPGPEEIVALASQALAVETPEEVEARILPGSASPEEGLEYLRNLPETDGPFGKVEPLTMTDINGLMVEGAIVNLHHSSGEVRNRLIMLTPDDDGVWKMDLAAFARSAEPAWDELLSGDAESAVVRVYVERDNYYNAVFADERRWRCYAVASPDVPQLMFGYVVRGSAGDQALAEIVGPGQRPMRATIELRRVEGAEDRQFEISRVLAQDWLVRGPLFEERFK